APAYKPKPADEAPAAGSRYAPLTPWGFIGSFILLNLPLAGFILTIVWACGGVRNLNRRNLARAIVIVWLISLAITLVLALIAVIFGGALFTGISEALGGGDLGGLLEELLPGLSLN
ncbi:MAG: hypothetical protein IJL69_04080, partial [Oscillospiraceae bacterium]|nr:hypothetical protein [Oscillospiraceae bacterium]